MKNPFRLVAAMTAVLLGLAGCAVVLFYAGVESILINRFFNLTYEVHNGNDPALQMVSRRGTYEKLTYERYIKRLVAEAGPAGSAHFELAAQKLRARFARDPEWVEVATKRLKEQFEYDLECIAESLRDELAEKHSPVETVYLQNGRYYGNELINSGRFGHRFPVMGLWTWETVHYPLLPVGENLLHAVELPRRGLLPGDGAWNWTKEPPPEESAHAGSPKEDNQQGD